MLTSDLQKRFSLAFGLFFLIPALAFVGGCDEQDAPNVSANSSQENEPQHDGHSHEDHTHETDVGSAQSVVSAELDADAQAALDQIMTSYLTVQQRLAEDQMEGVQAELDELHDAAHALFRSDAPGIEGKARAVAEPVHHEPQDLDEARELFKSLSAAVIDLTNSASPGDDVAPTLYRAHCPMADADWLQTSNEIVNPYMGQDMLRCGEIAETVKASDQE